MRFILALLVFAWAGVASAQTSDADRNFITGLIEDAVNSDELTVRLINFQGALSSSATADAITIADPEGVWLRLDGLTIEWNRSALLSGRVEIDTLSADRIEVIRLPVTDPEAAELPSAEATPFSLPDLPVSINIADVSAAEIVLTEALLGEPISARFAGSLKLGSGEGSTDFTLERTDSKVGRFVVDASYENLTRQLGLFLLAEEGENGIAARMINLPDRPAVKLEIAGDAPLDDFVGEIALATDGTDRITGTVQLSRPSGSLDQAFGLDLQGDLRPMLPDQYDAFFGTSTVLQVEGTSFGLGGLRLSNLVVAAEQVVLRGSASIDANGWPEAIDLRGRLGSGGTDRVLLPFGDTPTEVSGMSLNVQYDAADDAAWTGAFDITSLGRDGLSIDALALSGGGVIIPSAVGARGRFSADLNYAARGLMLDDAALSEAIGSDIEGTIDFGRLQGSPFVVRDLTLSGAGIEMRGNAYIDGPDDRFSTRAELGIQADDFSRFAALTGLDLTGGGTVDLSGTAQPFDGIFDLDVAAQTSDLTLGIEQADGFLAGDSTLSLQVERDTDGTRLRGIDVRNDALNLNGRAEITALETTANFTARINDLTLVTPTLSGPAVLIADVATTPDGVINLDADVTAPRASLTVNGTATPIEGGYILRPDAVVAVEELSAYGAIIGQQVNGAATIRLDGSYTTTSGALAANVAAQTRDIVLGIAQADAFLTGESNLSLRVERDEDSTRLRSIELQNNAVGLTGRAEITADATATANVSALIKDLTLVTPSLSGTGVLTADVATNTDGVIRLDADVIAPRATATISGTATPIEGGYVLRPDAVLAVEELSAYGAIVGQQIGGGITVNLDGTYTTPTGAMNADVTAQTRDLRAGSPEINRILAGLGRVSANVSLSDAGRLRLDAIDVVFPNLTANGAVASSGADTQATLSMRLRDIALLVPDFSGPLVADVSARQNAAGWNLTGEANGPIGTAARVSGLVGNNGQLNLSVSGSAPLALANIYIAPRQVNGLAQFDLSVNGPAALSSVRGPVTISDARLAAPTLQQALEDINGTIQLAGGTARLDIGAASVDGGRIALSGPVDLAAPFQASLTAELIEIVLRDPTLYRATANGRITVNGPLAGGARIAGQIDVGAVEVQVPSTGVSALGSLPEITHLGPRLEIARTLERAGVGAAAPTEREARAGPDYPIDVLIRAPSRIFVRGRGLDAELGGELSLTGSVNNLIPIGRFDLVRGRLTILAQQFDLSEGYAQLQGDFSPFLRLVATTEARTGTDISIIVEGPADDIEVRFESTPPLPQDEVLAQLLFGRDISSISPIQAIQLASAAANLAGAASENGGVFGSLREGLDLDDFDIVTDQDGNAGVRAGKYISENIYTDVTIGSTGNSEINLNIDIDRNFTARGTVGSDGDTSVGIFFERDY